MMMDEHTSESVHQPVTTAAGVSEVVTEPAYLAEPPQTWVVERIDSDGEELPIVRHAATWLPAPVALRYVLRTRDAIGPAQLIMDMRAVAILYNWFENAAGLGNFEDFLTAGRFLSGEQLKDLAAALRWRRKPLHGPGQAGRHALVPVADQTYNVRLFAIQEYLKWAYDPANHGGRSRVSVEKLGERRRAMHAFLEDKKRAVEESNRHEPLSAEEVQLIRRAVGPNKFGEFPPGVFSKETRYRNWIMFETALNLGLRKSELITIKVEYLSRGRVPHEIYVARQQDAPEDPRTRRRPRGKTLERLVPLMDPNILPMILDYRDGEPPAGRGSHESPYLFLTAAGSPVSNSTADRVIKRIGEYALRALEHDELLDATARTRWRESLRKMSWHRLRHTWAEAAALELNRRKKELARAILKNWGGWTREESMERYIEYAENRIASEEGVRQINERLARISTLDAAKHSVRAGEQS